MANRPRRPKSNAGPATTAASGKDGVEAPESAADAAGLASKAEGEAGATTAMTPGDESPATTSASEPETGLPSDASSSVGGTSGLPSPAQKPPPPGEPAPVEAMGFGGGAARPDEKPAGEEPASTLAAEERLNPAGEPRRDLGEFEDDETVLAAAEPAEPATVEPYRDPHDVADPGATGTRFGALLGAALLGGVIAAGLGALLLYSGVLPDNRQTEAAQQYASAGDVEQVQGDLGSLRETVEQLQSAQAAGGVAAGGVSAGDFAQLTDRVTAAERALQEVPGSNEETAGAAASATEAAAEAAQAAEAATQTANEAAEQARAAQAAATQAGQRLDEFDTRLAAIEEANRRAAVAFSAAGLKVAIDRGGPFMSELEAFAETTGGGEAVESLREYAARGVPTQAQLVGQWAEAEEAILAAVRAPEAGTAVGDQVLSGLRSLVTVRPAEAPDPQAEGPEAAVARMDAAIEAGDLAAWRSEWEALPEAARQASEEFAANVQARLQAMQVVDEALDSASGAATGSNEG